MILKRSVNAIYCKLFFLGPQTLLSPGPPSDEQNSANKRSSILSIVIEFNILPQITLNNMSLKK